MTTAPVRNASAAIFAFAGGMFGILAVQIVGILLSVLNLAADGDSSALIAPTVLVAGWLVAGAALAALAVVAIKEGLPRTLRAGFTALIVMLSLLVTLPWALSYDLGSMPIVGLTVVGILAIVSVLTPSTRTASGNEQRLYGNPVLGGLLWGFYALMVAGAAGIVLVTLVRIVLEPAEWAAASRQSIDGSELGFLRGRGGGSLGGFVLLTPLFLAAVAWLVYWPALTVTSTRHRTMKLAELQGHGRVRLAVLSVWSVGLLVLQVAIALTWQGEPGSWLPAELTGLFFLHQIIVLPLLALSLARASMTAQRGLESPLGAGRVIGMLALGVAGAVVLVPLLASPLLIG